VAEIADLAGFSEKDCDKICLAVDEACSNVIRHSYKERPDGEIIIKCSFDSGRLSISIRDFGEKFDAKEIQPLDPNKVKPGGLGVHMIKSVMDEVEYDCSHEVGTEIHMTKYVHPEEN
jgi:anti-sigma regulatory factor (Ser/Thr protein kinase)